MKSQHPRPQIQNKTLNSKVRSGLPCLCWWASVEGHGKSEPSLAWSYQVLVENGLGIPVPCRLRLLWMTLVGCCRGTAFHPWELRCATKDSSFYKGGWIPLEALTRSLSSSWEKPGVRKRNMLSGNLGPDMEWWSNREASKAEKPWRMNDLLISSTSLSITPPICRSPDTLSLISVCCCSSVARSTRTTSSQEADAKSLDDIIVAQVGVFRDKDKHRSEWQWEVKVPAGCQRKAIAFYFFIFVLDSCSKIPARFLVPRY